MRKIIALFFAQFAFAQNPSIATNLPEIIPPSPTVSALMKFEEVPVSNYSGVPNISIQLFSSKTLCKDVDLNIALKYHPNSIAANERASDVGLGWSIFTGGTISRTVRGLPDETNSINGQKFGIYTNGLNPSANNNYYTFENYDSNNNINWENFKEYLWNKQVVNMMDSEHDLWQFNFFNYSGRFYIRKNTTTNQLEIKPLDDYRIKINNIYGNSQNPFIPTSFVIYDEKGIKYIFDVIEKTLTNTTSFSNNAVYPGNNIEFNASFHLSKIYDTNNNLIIEYIYNNNDIREIFIDGTEIQNINLDSLTLQSILDNCEGTQVNLNPLPEIQNLLNQRTTLVKKISQININGIAKINFEFQQGRSDSNLINPNLASFLKSIKINDWKNQVIKTYLLDYAYKTSIYNRLFLSEIKTLDKLNIEVENTKFLYKENTFDQSEYYLGKDYWGYLNLIPNGSLNPFYLKNTSKKYCTTDSLESIYTPTKGTIYFNFESNEYSFNGNQQLTDFSDNEDNYSITNHYYPFPNSQTVYSLPFSATETKKAIFSPSLTLNEQYAFVSLKKNGVQEMVFFCPNDIPNCKVEVTLEANSNYTLHIGIADPIYYSQNPVGISMKLYSKNSANKQFSYGGGIRIKEISYFDEKIIKDPNNENGFVNLNNTISIPKKSKKYIYTLPSNSNFSSGSLAFSKPLFEYQQTKRECYKCLPYQLGSGYFIENDNIFMNYQTRTNFNNLKSLRTQGSDIGYKYVKVYETGNGYTNFNYTSPIDYPEIYDELSFKPPFLETQNFDYKRGLILNESVFDNSNKLILESNFTYDFVNFTQRTGIKTYYSSDSFVQFDNYNTYQNYISSENDPNKFCKSGDISNFISIKPIIELFGWAKLTSKTSKQYFYNGANSNVVETTENYTYNNVNKQIESVTTTNSQAEPIKTNYFYHTGNSTFSQNRIAEIERIESLKNNSIISETKINYVNTFGGNASFLPQSVLAKKGANPLESRLKYLSYDEYGKPTELQKENGVSVVYIYGYNKSLPIAKIENATYTQVSTSVANLQTLSDTGTEANLIAALNNLRSNLPNAMVTTFTHIPLVGVSTITDPKGEKVTYVYDNFNRLKHVIDHQGNILSENNYNYRAN